MTTENRSRFSVITNKDIEEVSIKKEPSSSYQTNPFYERLVKFSNDANRKRFTVEDLLKW